MGFHLESLFIAKQDAAEADVSTQTGAMSCATFLLSPHMIIERAERSRAGEIRQSVMKLNLAQNSMATLYAPIP